MVCNIVDFGAVSDGKTLATKAIQNAIDTCAENGGGRVLIPAGNYKSGSFFLKSNVELFFETGAVLTASDNMDDYNRDDAYEQNYGFAPEGWRAKHLIMAVECQNVSISGNGIINGNGDSFRKEAEPADCFYVWMDGVARVKDEKVMRPGQLVCFVECQNVSVSDITLENAPCWGLFFHGCRFVYVDGVQVFNKKTSLNTDGIDIDCCRFVTVSNCNIDTGDDAIAIRTSGARLKKALPCEFITITNCNLSSSACAFRVGVGRGHIRHIRVSNITVQSASSAIKYMTSYCGSGEAHIQDVHFSGVSVALCSFPVSIQGDRGSVKNVSVTNLFANSLGGIKIDPASNCETAEQEKPESLCEMKNISLSDVSLNIMAEDREITEKMIVERGEEALYIGEVKGVTLSNLKICVDERAKQTFKGLVKFENPNEVKLINIEL